jgi:hypothetical protein
MMLGKACVRYCVPNALKYRIGKAPAGTSKFTGVEGCDGLAYAVLAFMITTSNCDSSTG